MAKVCLSASALVCMVEQGGQTRRDRSPHDKAGGGLRNRMRPVRRGRGACEERAREGKKCCEVDLYTSHSCRSYYHDDESTCSIALPTVRSFSSRPIIPFLARHAQGLVVQGIEIQAGQAQSACNYMTLQSPQKKRNLN